MQEGGRRSDRILEKGENMDIGSRYQGETAKKKDVVMFPAGGDILRYEPRG